MAESQPPAWDAPPAMTSITLTEVERRACARALNMAAAMLDALDDRVGSGTAMELAARICPEEDLV